jgi:hypothetical protein
MLYQLSYVRAGEFYRDPEVARLRQRTVFKRIFKHLRLSCAPTRDTPTRHSQ